MVNIHIFTPPLVELISCLFVCLFVCPFVCLSAYLFVCLFICLFVCLLADLPGMFDVKIVNADLELAYKQLTQAIFGVSAIYRILHSCIKYSIISLV